VKELPEQETIGTTWCCSYGAAIKKARERPAKGRKERLTRALDELGKISLQKRNTQDKANATDPACRIMGQSDGGYAPV
jgi:hypothetical protein